MSASQPAHTREWKSYEELQCIGESDHASYPAIASATALAVAFTVSLAPPAYAGEVTITPPPCPANIRCHREHGISRRSRRRYPELHLPALRHCFKFALFTPQATLFNNADKEVITHYFQPQPG